MTLEQNPALELPSIVAKLKNLAVEADETKEEKDNMSVTTKKPALVPVTARTTGEVLPPDKLFELAGEIENLTNAEEAVFEFKILELEEAENWYRRGGVLSKMRREKWFLGHDTFKDMVEIEFNLSRWKTNHLVKIYEVMVNAKVSWADVETVGWSKMRLVCGHAPVDDDGHVDRDWVVAHATSAKSKTFKQLEADIKNTPALLGGKAAAKTQTVVLKMHEDQAETYNEVIEPVKKALGTESDAVALDHILIEQLSTLPGPAPYTAPAPVKKVVKNWMRSVDYEAVMELVEEVFPDAP